MTQRFVFVSLFLCFFCSCNNSYQAIELESNQTAKSETEEKFPLKFDAANVDLGEAETHFEHSFSFRNDSDDTIDHIKLLSSCGCAKITITPESVAPHQEGHVLLEIDQTGKGFGRQLYTGFVEYKVKDKITRINENEYFKGNCRVWRRDREPIEMLVISDDGINVTIQTDHESNECLVSFLFPTSKFNTIFFLKQ